MDLARRHGLFASFTFILAGCSTHPLVDDVTRITTYDVVEQIRCEARRAVVDHAQGMKNAAIAYEFTFHITESNNASGSITTNLPFKSGGTFGAVGSAGANGTRDSLRNFKIVDSFDDLRAAQCAPEILQKNWVYPISGEIGIYEVIATFVKLTKVSHLTEKKATSGEVFSFADTLTFTTVLSAGVAPSLTMLPAVGKFRATSASLNLTAGRTDIHSVVIGVAAQPETPTARALRGTSSSGGLRAGLASGGLLSTNTALSTTLIQSAANVQQRALYELDRQRLLALQDRTQNLLVGP